MPVFGAGVHDASVKDVRWNPPHGDFPPQLSIHFENATGDYIAWYLKLGMTLNGFNQKQFDMEMATLSDLGWDAEENGYAFETLQDPLQCPFSTWTGQIEVDLYQGKPQFKWVRRAGGSGGGERMEPDAAKAWCDTLRQRLAASGKAIKAPPAARPRPAPAAVPVSAQRDVAQTPEEKAAFDKMIEEIPF